MPFLTCAQPGDAFQRRQIEPGLLRILVVGQAQEIAELAQAVLRRHHVAILFDLSSGIVHVDRQHFLDDRALPVAIAERGVSAEHQEAGPLLDEVLDGLKRLRADGLHLPGCHVAEDDDVVLLLVEAEQIAAVGVERLPAAQPDRRDADARILAQRVADELRLHRALLVHQQDADAFLGDGDERFDLVVEREQVAGGRFVFAARIVRLDAQLDLAGLGRGVAFQPDRRCRWSASTSRREPALPRYRETDGCERCCSRSQARRGPA